MCRALPLSQAGFAPFGDVIEHRGTERRHCLSAAFASAGEGVRHALWVSRIERRARLPLEVTMLEKHPNSDQAFIPLVGQPYLVVACGSAADGSPDTDTARAFLAAANQGVIYRRSVWHFGLTVLAAPADFVVVMGLTGAADDVFQELAGPLTVLPGEGAG